MFCVVCCMGCFCLCVIGFGGCLGVVEVIVDFVLVE